MPPWVRRWLSFACLVAAWLVAHPARAAAPICDQHGASALAPLPILDAPDASATSAERVDCDGDDGDKSIQRGERPHRLPCRAHADVVPTAPTVRVAAFVVGTLPPPDASGSPRRGVAPLLERPPR